MGNLSENKEKLAHHLAQFQQGGVLNRIAGKDKKGSGGTFHNISPVDKSVICDVARGAAADIDAAATAAAAVAPAATSTAMHHAKLRRAYP